MEPRSLFPGIGEAVARRTILRPFHAPTETWADVAQRVAAGNASLHPTGAADQAALEQYTNAMVLLWSGRHLQHGDKDQSTRPQSVFTNCSTSPTSFMLFAYLLAGSGVGTAYDDALKLVDWTQMPSIRFVLKPTHPDFEEAVRDLGFTPHEFAGTTDSHMIEVEDSREGWAQLIEALEVAAYSGKHVAEVWAIDFSKVRGRGSPIGGMQSRPASGPVPLMGALKRVIEMLQTDPTMPKWEQAMRVDHELAATVAVGGARRAARMATKYWKDTDILKFATIKRDGGLWSSNNSIAIDNEFWKALDAGQPLATKLFEMVMQAQYHDGSGEPGLINVSALDRDPARDEASFNALQASKLIDREQYPWAPETLPYLEAVLSAAKRSLYRYVVNPCVPGNTPILTREGFRPIEDCVGEQVDVWNGFEWSEVTPQITGYNQPLLKLTFTDGRELTCTMAHKFEIIDPESGRVNRYRADELDVGDRLPRTEFPVIHTGTDAPEAYTQGFKTGDGLDGYKFIDVYDGKAMCIGRLQSTHVAEHSHNGRTRVRVVSSGLPKAYVPMLEWSVQSRLDWFAGLVDSDGTVTKDGSLQISSVGREQLLKVQEMLMTVGVACKVRPCKAAERKLLPDGRGGMKEYDCKALFRLLIPTKGVRTLISLGFRCERVSLEAIPEGGAARFVAVESIEEAGVADVVYCFTEPKRNLGCFNGVITGQCSEIPLSIVGGVCIIGDLVPFHTDSLEELMEAAALMTRALIRVNLMRPGFRAEVERTNRIGVGLTGVHEYAAKQFGLTWHDLVCESELLLTPALRDVLDADWPIEEIERYMPHVTSLRSWPFWSTLYRVRLHITQVARAYSAELRLPMPRTALTVKPAGSTSKLAGLTEGVHLPAMARYLRWVQFQHGSPQIAEYEAQGYPVRHEIRNAQGEITYPNVSIVGFPTKLPIADLLPEDQLVTASEATMDDQFDWLRLLETYWLGDRYGAQVSYTLKWNRADVSYEDYVATMRDQLPKVRCVSVMTSDDWRVTQGLYGYSPEQPMEREAFDALVARIQAGAQEEIDLEMLRCAGGACPI